MLESKLAGLQINAEVKKITLGCVTLYKYLVSASGEPVFASVSLNYLNC